MSADNQQERLDAQWIVGFVDGEGCFHVALNKQTKMTLGWQVLPEFRVVQHKRDEAVLYRIRETFGCGVVCTNNGDRKELRVRGLENLIKIVEFFKEHQLHTVKAQSFEFFSQIITIMKEGKHLTQEGLHEIAHLASLMNTKENRSASRILRDCTPDQQKC